LATARPEDFEAKGEGIQVKRVSPMIIINATMKSFSFMLE